ncbi:P2Y purinoceptor 3 [Kryptolebias marmoratus]|uniref:Pyrimidinergic receptor P2Y6 n=1 Tax=Kryptolebias marmoratus TaxID=37003 RepID=A0A3Q3A628_KRYMA|nr:P2Y purinoceptor 3 [Kryptolebias marmoratus]XP_037836684.1 P2Y purinoceptor 3 [Kryptolebias marmoratus]
MPYVLSSLPMEPNVFPTSGDPLGPYTAALPAGANSSSPRCTYEESFKRILLPAVYSIVFLLGVPLNAAVIVQIWRSKRSLSVNVYMLNLAVADLLYVMSLPLPIFNYASSDYWPFGQFACKLVKFQFYSNLHGSILFLTCISVQRYIGICYPFHMRHNLGGCRAAWCVCGGVWLVVAALCAPTFHFVATGTQRNRTVCYDLSTPECSADYYPYGMALIFIGFLLPFLGVMVCYGRMAQVLCRRDSSQEASRTSVEKRDRAVKMIAVITVVFCVSFLPFHLTKAIYLVVRSLPNAGCETRNFFSILFKSMRPFASMNSILDPILFYFIQPKHRETIRRSMYSATTIKKKIAPT